MESVIELPHRKPCLPPLPMGGGKAVEQRPTEELAIGMLVFRCPATQWNIKTGIATDRRTFLRIQQFGVRVHCRACQRLHEFRVASGVMAPFA